jgi:hypothetical protein
MPADFGDTIELPSEAYTKIANQQPRSLLRTDGEGLQWPKLCPGAWGGPKNKKKTLCILLAAKRERSSHSILWFLHVLEHCVFIPQDRDFGLCHWLPQ